MNFKEFTEKLNEAAYGRRDAYQRDYDSSVSGFGKRPREDDEYHNEPKSTSRDVPHAVHINGKKWKTFGSQSHASNVAKKIKGATVHKEEFEQIDELSRDTLLSYANKVSLDSQKHSKDPTKRSGEKASRSVTGYARAHNRLEKPVKESKEYDEAQEHLSKANDADAKGDKKSFHAHMANHHDSMSEWHDSKGRSASADKHAEKADYHHEKSLSEETITEMDEAFINGREYASQGVMHPTHAAMHKVGDSRDFYAHGTGDKLSGKVTKNTGKEVHIQADKSSGGKTHKFKVTPHLPKPVTEASDTVVYDSSGKVKSWSHAGDWKKTNPNKNPEGKVHNLAGQALQKTKKLAKEEIALDEDLSKTPTDKLQKHWDAHKDQERPSPVFAAHLRRVGQELAKRKKAMKEESELDEGTYSADVERAFPGGKASGVKTHPVAPVPDRKYIKGTPEHKAHKEAQKPRTGHPTVKEETVNEVLKPSMGAGKYIKDFQKSDAPQFKGKSMEKKRIMGIAAYLQAKRDMKEETEHLDENVYDGPDQANAIKKALVKKHKDNNYNVRVNQKGQHVIDHAYYGSKKVKSQIKALGEEVELDEATVKTHKYSWGTMKTVHHGADFSIPLHPEHHHEIAKLKDEQEHKFKDETGRHWTARRKGEDVHFHSANDGPKTVVKHSDLKEDIDVEKLKQQSNKIYANAPAPKKPEEKKQGVMDKLKSAWNKADPSKHKEMAAKHGVKYNEEFEYINEEDLDITLTQEEFDDIAEKYMGFEKTTKALAAKGAKNPKALAAWIGRNKYGKGKFQKAAATGHSMRKEEAEIDEELVGGQKKLDKNHNGKLDKQDFKMLRKEEKECPKCHKPMSQCECDMDESVNFDDEGNLVAEKVSYSNFIRNLQEIKMSDLPVRKVTGRAYGGGGQKDAPEHDEDDDEKPKAKPEPAVKRGRGRPMGSKSGANQKVTTSGAKRSGVDYTGYKLHLPNTNKSY